MMVVMRGFAAFGKARVIKLKVMTNTAILSPCCCFSPYDVSVYLQFSPSVWLNQLYVIVFEYKYDCVLERREWVRKTGSGNRRRKRIEGKVKE